jgi:hypothetical protein
MATAWLPHGYRMATAWLPHGYRMAALSAPQCTATSKGGHIYENHRGPPRVIIKVFLSMTLIRQCFLNSPCPAVGPHFLSLPTMAFENELGDQAPLGFFDPRGLVVADGEQEVRLSPFRRDQARTYHI